MQTNSISRLRSINYAERTPVGREACILSVSGKHSDDIHRDCPPRRILVIFNLKISRRKPVGIEKSAVGSVSSLRCLCLRLQDTLQFPPVLSEALGFGFFFFLFA